MFLLDEFSRPAEPSRAETATATAAEPVPVAEAAAAAEAEAEAATGFFLNAGQNLGSVPLPTLHRASRKLRPVFPFLWLLRFFCSGSLLGFDFFVGPAAILLISF